MQLRQSLAYKRGETKAKLIFVLKRLGQNVGEEKKGEKKRKKRKKKEKEKKTKTKVCFVLKSCLIWVFWIPRVLVWGIVAPLYRVLEEITQTLEFVGVMRVKPQLVENKHGIILIIWFLEGSGDLWLNS